MNKVKITALGDKRAKLSSTPKEGGKPQWMSEPEWAEAGVEHL